MVPPVESTTVPFSVPLAADSCADAHGARTARTARNRIPSIPAFFVFIKDTSRIRFWEAPTSLDAPSSGRPCKIRKSEVGDASEGLMQVHPHNRGGSNLNWSKRDLTV